MPKNSTRTIAPFVGIDVSKARLDVALFPSGDPFACDNTSAQVDALAARIAALHPELVVLEPTGGLERPIAEALERAGVPVAIVNARQIRDFAKATGQLAKTDRLDALVLAHFGESIRPTPRPLPDAAARAREALQTRRRQLVDLRAQERNHLASAPTSLQPEIRELIAQLTERVEEIEARLKALIAEDEALNARAKLLTSVTGIGVVTARMLITNLPELGTLTRRTVARLLGIAPLNDDSGAHTGKRFCKGGRADVRSGLYLPTLTATRMNGPIKDTYDRLIKRGKPHKVAMIACMRKLLTILNAMVRDGKPWKEELAASR